MPSFWKDIYVCEAFLMTFPLLVMISLRNTLFPVCLLLYFTPLFHVGSKINDHQRTLLTRALRFGDGAFSSHCLKPGATDE